MRNNKKIINIFLLMIMLVFLGSSLVFAENTVDTINTSNTQNTNTQNTNTQNNTQSENVQNTNSQNAQSTQNTQNTQKTQTTQSTNVKPKTTKSSNANLSNLGIKPNDFSGFSENKTEYSVSVPNTVKTVEVYAKAKDSKSSVKGTGNINLQEGQNVAKVTVTAEDGTAKTYTITITRVKQGEQTEETTKETIKEQNNNGKLALKTLTIEGCNLEPEFDAEKYLYNVNFEGDQTSLNIKAESTQSSNLIQIIGNENFIDGKNMVTIMVSDSNENNLVVYQINVNKNLKQQQEIQKQFEDAENAYKIKFLIIKILIGVIAVGIIVLLILIHKREKHAGYEEEYEEDLPKSLRKNKIDKKEKNNKKKKGKGRHSK